MSTTKFPKNNNEYTNPTFLASNNDLTFPNRSQQNIWSTSNSYLPENSQYHIKNKDTNLKVKNLKSLQSKDKKSFNKRCILITSILLIITFIVLVAIGFSLTYYYYWKPKYENKVYSECFEKCRGDTYCVRGRSSTENSTCICKPGYKLNYLSGKCLQSSCVNEYYPHTYINNQSPQKVSSYDTQFIKPYCCPNPDYLTNSCCGVSTSDTSVTVSKRIIGGQKLNSGVFPWIVFVTQVHRTNRQHSLQMIRNCSGTLLNERYVLLAAHCLDVDRSLFNGEFTNAASMARVYFGFVDKSDIFRDGIIEQHERRVQRVIFHPKYDQATLRNDLVILRLDKPIYRDLNSDYLCLNTDLQDNRVTKLYTAGWGSTNPNHLSLSYPEQINYVDAVVFPMSFCKYIYPEPGYDFLFNETTHVCAGYQAAVGKDTCYSDSGAPLMIERRGQWFAYGVVTFGSQPDCAQGPSMFIRISFYYNWIKSVIHI